MGRALATTWAAGKVARSDVFIVSKLPNAAHHPDDVEPTLRKTLAVRL